VALGAHEHAGLGAADAPVHDGCLASYRPDATSEEAQAIDEICSDISFRRVQLRIVTGEIK
jgi:hypothetical protein